MTTNNELAFKEYKLSCHALKVEKMRMFIVKQNLLAINEKYDITTKRLLSLKTEFELYRSHLQNSLFKKKLTTDKQKILLKKKLNEFLENQKRVEEYYKMCPIRSELGEIIRKNNILQEEYKKKIDLFELTKQQHNDLLNMLLEAFKKKVCEFCCTVLEYEKVEPKIIL